ncbi:nitrate- and nitrite sensing domain-containing protein [Spirillospora sp. NPDC047279]|uniref:sensor histidine kinase n=1 Tax=Spirillospora sp. NPDC047279 TaxID=3155478 RepID=UPI0033EAA4B7
MSLTALWVFAAWVTLREGVNLLWVTTYDSKLASPTDPLIVELQQERRLTIIRLADPSTPRNSLDAQRERTDKARASVKRLARSGTLEMAAGTNLQRRIDEMIVRLDALDAGRASIDSGATPRPQAVALYSEVVESIFRTYDEISGLDDEQIAKDTRALLQLNRMWELLSQEDALVTGALTSGRITALEQTQFTQLVGARRLNTTRTLTEMQHSDPALFRAMTQNPRFTQIQQLEDQLIQNRRLSQKFTQPGLAATEWSAASQPALQEMRRTIQASGDRLVERAMPTAIWVVIRLLLAGGLGLVAVIASIVLSITTVRGMFRQLQRLRDAARELSEQRLPDVVDRLGHGDQVDVAKEAPPLEFGQDEIGQVGRAFNAVQETAIRTAVEQAELRRGIRDVLLSLARRTQTLVHRQLSMLDQMERKRDIDPKDLQELFRLDHLATRMRRNAENLIVLSGAIPARGWRRAVPMIDVVRAAVGEVEDYTRVQVLPITPVELTGRAVGDVTHLLAELIENAVTFSPPDTVVQIGGHPVASGFAIDIEDRGLGMDDEKLAEINRRIADPPEFNLQSSVQLGLFVVGKLAERYGLQVSLKRSAYGGTTAVVVIPRELVTSPAEDGSTGPRQLPAGATTQNGLTVRQPALTTATAEIAAAEPPPAPITVLSTGNDELFVPGPAGPPDSEPARTGPVREVPPPVRLDSQRTEVAAAPRDAGTAPLDAGAGAAGEPPAAEGEPMPESSSTPGGLPVRVPQASLAPALKTEEPEAPAEPDEDDPGRSPEEIQRIMGSYQRGTVRGRTDAAQNTVEGTVEGEDEQ